MDERPTIDCTPNGPYLVRQLDHLEGSHGQALPAQPVMALCRCGGSANKPFCDGTHQRIGFTDAKAADRVADQRQSYPAGRLTIHDNRSICAHAGRCTDGLASVFKYGSEPWIDPAGGAVDAVIETIRSCPSGALSYTLDGVDGAGPPREPSIAVGKDGPYAVSGGVGLTAASWAQGASPEHYTLCRCGGSRNKPFCDGTHWSIGFKDEAR